MQKPTELFVFLKKYTEENDEGADKCGELTMKKL